MSDDKSHDISVSEESRNYVYANRRYVGKKETVGYVMWDMAQSFNINSFASRYVTNILQVDLSLQQVATSINGVWDVVNDIFTAAFVERTRTRWGKFKPYLIFLAGPGTIGTAVFWFMSYLFPDSAPDYIPKFFFYIGLQLLREGIGTFQGIAQTGLLATITPHPVDRTRIITIANFWSGTLGEKLPEQIMTILIDMVGNGKMNSKDGVREHLYRKLYSGMGVFTSLVAGGASLWFNVITRERVMQSIEKPSIKQSIKSITNNRPVLLLTASEILGTISVSAGGKSDYFIEVLNLASMVMLVGIPGAIFNPISYAIVPWFRRKFSTRFLYFYCYLISNVSMIPVFFIGSIGGMVNGFYKNKWIIGIALSIQELVFMTQYGLSKVVHAEMYNESMDYCEWRNGYRTEAMTSVAKGLAVKIGRIFTDILNLQVKKWINYDQTLYSKGQKQSDSTQYFLFMSATLLPVLSSILSVIPMFFWNLNKKSRELMYAELLERRAAMSSAATSAGADELSTLAHEQFSYTEKNKDRNLNQ